MNSYAQGLTPVVTVSLLNNTIELQPSLTNRPQTTVITQDPDHSSQLTLLTAAHNSQLGLWSSSIMIGRSDRIWDRTVSHDEYRFIP